MFEPGYAVLGGLVGGVAFLIIVQMGHVVGMTRMDFLRILGTMMTPRIPRGGAHLAGFMIHMVASVGFGLLHGAISEEVGVTTIGGGVALGLALGLIHGVIILVVLPMVLSMMHPLVRRGEIERPGLALVGFGVTTPVGSLMAHAAFGVIVGAIYTAGVLFG